MKLLVFGASGLVGAAVARLAAAAGHEVTGVVGHFPGAIAGAARLIAADLVDVARVRELVHTLRPDAIVNAAAISEPAVCDAQPALAEALNVQLPAALAATAPATGVRLVHISSEQVFDGTRSTPYTRADAVNPINRYGRQKVAAEDALLEAAPGLAAIVRAPLLMGDSPGGRRGVHERLLGDWAAGRVARLYTDEFRQPCTAADLAAVLVALAERRALCGVLHWAGAELISRHELGRRVRDHFRLSAAAAPIAAITRADTPAVARERQACLALDVAPLDTLLGRLPQPLDAQLATLRVPTACAAWHAAMTVR